MLDDFLTRALLAGIGLALVTGPAGCFVVWRRLAYFGETIAHSALLGVALAILLEIHLVIGIFASASAIVLVMFFLERRDTLPVDTLLGLLAHGGLALGLVVLAFVPSVRFNLHGLLFGDILAVSRTDLAIVWGGRRGRAGGVVVGVAPAAGRDRGHRPGEGGGPAAGARAPGVRAPHGGDHRRGHQDRRCAADRRVARDPGGDGAPLLVEPRADGRRCSGGGHRVGGRGDCSLRPNGTRHRVPPSW